MSINFIYGLIAVIAIDYAKKAPFSVILGIRGLRESRDGAFHFTSPSFPLLQERDVERSETG